MPEKHQFIIGVLLLAIVTIIVDTAEFRTQHTHNFLAMMRLCVLVCFVSAVNDYIRKALRT